MAFILPNVSEAQTTAMDFNRMDCNGNMRHLFTDLDSGKVVILEYFMGPNCTSCMDAAKEIEAMKAKFLATHPGKVMTYAMGFQNSYSCATITAWVTSQSLSAIPMDSAALQVAYYGGFSMPTIVVVAGTSHNIIYTANPNNGGYANGDTSKMSIEINKFFNPTNVKNIPASIGSVNIYPNPANGSLHVQFDVKQPTAVSIRIIDVTGKVVADAVNENVSKGNFTKAISTSDLAQGVYMLSVSANGHTSYNRISIVNND